MDVVKVFTEEPIGLEALVPDTEPDARQRDAPEMSLEAFLSRPPEPYARAYIAGTFLGPPRRVGATALADVEAWVRPLLDWAGGRPWSALEDETVQSNMPRGRRDGVVVGLSPRARARRPRGRGSRRRAKRRAARPTPRVASRPRGRRVGAVPRAGVRRLGLEPVLAGAAPGTIWSRRSVAIRPIRAGSSLRFREPEASTSFTSSSGR